ncbi:MAG: tetratricopeptide repeat protein [Hyphomicrobiaceae bacterium]|nr:tetratricopeptide repeat protein [Hyphomicrobiaceae bacterium]
MTDQAQQYSIQQVQEAHQKLTQADQAFSSGDSESAMEACLELLEQYPDYYGALSLVGSIHAQQGNFGGALPFLVRASLINPYDGEMWRYLGWTYLELEAIPSALEALERSVSLSQNTSVADHLLGAITFSAGKFETALKHFEASRALDPKNTGVLIRRAMCLAKLGRIDEAVQQLKTTYQQHLSADHKALVYQLLAEFPELDQDLGLIDQIDEDDDAASTPDLAQFVPSVSLYDVSRDFARGIALDLRGQHQEAWQILSAANKRIADATSTQRDKYFLREEELAQKAELWTPQSPVSEQEDTEGPVVLFILGPSRSGKTTAENLMASLDGVEKAFENSLVDDVAQRVSKRAGFLTEYSLVNLPSHLNEEVSNQIQDEVDKLAGREKLVTITHPGVIFDVSRLKDIIPNSRFIFMKRNRDDMALRIFAYLYRSNTNHFAYDINEIYRYLETHDRLIDVWSKKIGDRVLVQSYEDMVRDPEAAVRSIAELCSLKPPAKLDLQVPDDTGCAKPYLEWLHQSRKNSV